MIKKVTKQDLRAIEIGKTVIFTPSNRRLIQSIRSMAYQIGKMEPELGKIFSCIANYEKCEIAVSAKSSNDDIKFSNRSKLD